MKIMKILVTGSSGTIGTRLCERSTSGNYHVTGFDLKPNKWNPVINDRTVIGDLRHPSGLSAMSGNWDAVVHLAANARVHNLVVNPLLARDNLEMMVNILEFVRRRKIPDIIFASSREVYGNTYRIKPVRMLFMLRIVRVRMQLEVRWRSPDPCIPSLLRAELHYTQVLQCLW